MRSALVYWGHNPAPNVAYVLVNWGGKFGRQTVTWADVMAKRREDQCRRLELKRAIVEWRAYKLWVAYFDQNLMGGWHAFLEDWRGAGYRIWIDRDRTWMKAKLMETFPLCLPLGTECEQWERWKVEFARQFERRRQDRQPVGVAYIWWNQRDSPRGEL